jgi:hypothetical protein
MALALAAVALTGCEGGAQKVEEAVKLTLIDPSSAQFKEIENCSGDRAIWRGQVNAKNRMGAYVGFAPFFYDGASVATAGDEGDGFMKQMERCYADLKTPEQKAKDAAEAATKAVNGEWSVREEVNPVDDSRTTYASLESGEGSNAGGSDVTLVVRCQSRKTEIFVNWNEYLGDDSRDVYNEWKRVTVRVGSELAKTERWDVSTDNEATFAPSAVALAKRFAKADRLVLEVVPYGENPATAVFPLKGANSALKAVAANCGWTLD